MDKLEKITSDTKQNELTENITKVKDHERVFGLGEDFVYIQNSDNGVIQEHSKKHIKKCLKKSNKKILNAKKTICDHERQKEDDLFTDEPTKNVWVYHFGNGEEEDQVSIKSYLKKYGTNKVYIFPGICYGLIVFEDISDAKKLFEDEHAHHCHTVKFNSGTRTIYMHFSKLELKDVKINNTLTFPIASYKVEIPGLHVIDEFVTEDEEKELIKKIDLGQWIKMTNRRVQHYGFEFIYGTNSINKDKKLNEFPDFFSNITKRINEQTDNFYVKKSDPNLDFINIPEIKENTDKTNKMREDFSPSFYKQFGGMDQLTINDYSPGDGIPPHTDSHSPFEDIFVSISLGSGVVMTFTHENESKHLYIKPRSAIFFSSDIRFIWKHTISLRKLDRVDDDLLTRHRRVSLTFRKIRKSECKCTYINYCDSQKLDKSNNETDFKSTFNFTNKTETPTDLEKKHVYDVYDKIATHFSHTRYKPWPRVAEYLELLKPHSLNADIGCGNGKYLWVNENNLYNVGTDRCANFLSICREKIPKSQTFSADSLKLPFRSGVFDSAISIAVVHHFSNAELRMKAIKEIIRILSVNGTFLIYVWALENEGRNFTEQENFVPWHLQNTYEDDSKKLETLGPEIFKEKNSTVYHRYYHMFKKDELESLLKTFNNIEIEKSYYDNSNWCCICRKTKE